MKIILITGGSGYIGRHLQRALVNRYRVFAPTHQELELLDAAAVEKYFRSHKVEVVIHAAVVGGSRPEETVEHSLSTNLHMFFNVVRCRKYFSRFINLGSGAEYDKSRPLKKVSEDDFGKFIPNDEYGFYKYICAKYIEETNSNMINLRIFGLYGQGEDYRLRFISNMLVRKLLSLPLGINQDMVFDYVYIADFVRIIEHFIKHKGKYKFYNIGTGRPIHIAALASRINQMFDPRLPLTIGKAGLNKEYTCDTSRLWRELSNFRFTDLEISLRQMYDWYARHKQNLKL